MNWINYTLIVFGLWNIFDGVWSLWYKDTEHTWFADAGRVVRTVIGVALIVLAVVMGWKMLKFQMTDLEKVYDYVESARCKLYDGESTVQVYELVASAEDLLGRTLEGLKND